MDIFRCGAIFQGLRSAQYLYGLLEIGAHN